MNEIPQWVKYLLAVLVAFCAFWVWWGGGRADKTRRRRFHTRPELSLDEFLRSCGDPALLDRAMVEELLKSLSSALGIPVGKFRSTDMLAAELAPEKGWECDDALYPALDNWLRRCKEGADSLSQARIASLGDLVMHTCRRHMNPSEDFSRSTRNAHG